MEYAGNGLNMLRKTTLTTEKVTVILSVYKKLSDNEVEDWGPIDEAISLLEYLDEVQLFRESSVLYGTHKGHNVGCGNDPHQDECFIHSIVDAVSYILESYEDVGKMDGKGKFAYILKYYIALNQVGLIVIGK